MENALTRPQIVNRNSVKITTSLSGKSARRPVVTVIPSRIKGQNKEEQSTNIDPLSSILSLLPHLKKYISSFPTWQNKHLCFSISFHIFMTRRFSKNIRYFTLIFGKQWIRSPSFFSGLPFSYSLVGLVGLFTMNNIVHGMLLVQDIRGLLQWRSIWTLEWYNCWKENVLTKLLAIRNSVKIIIFPSGKSVRKLVAYVIRWKIKGEKSFLFVISQSYQSVSHKFMKRWFSNPWLHFKFGKQWSRSQP